MSLSPSSISFPGQYVGTSSPTQTVTVTNNGHALLNITSVSTSSPEFGAVNSCGSTLAVGASCAIGVFFDPTATDTRSGTLTINDDAQGSPQTVGLNGTRLDFSLGPPGSSVTVSAGQTADFTVWASFEGGFSNQTVQLTCTGAPPLSTCTVPSSATVSVYANVVDVQGSVTTTAPSTAQIIQFPVHNYRFRYLIIELFVLLLQIGLLSRQRIACPRLAYGLALFVFLSAGVMISRVWSGEAPEQVGIGERQPELTPWWCQAL